MCHKQHSVETEKNTSPIRTFLPAAPGPLLALALSPTDPTVGCLIVFATYPCGTKPKKKNAKNDVVFTYPAHVSCSSSCHSPNTVAKKKTYWLAGFLALVHQNVEQQWGSSTNPHPLVVSQRVTIKCAMLNPRRR